jgi:Ca2+-binding EF-hand superfamily protein
MPLSERSASASVLGIKSYIFSFEEELKARVALKAVGAKSSSAVALKAFKYFDLDDSGSISLEDFTKAIEKIGIFSLSK